MTRRLATLCAIAAVVAPLSACGPSTAHHKGEISAVASFYPIQFALEQIGGAKIDVTDLTKPGQEPHDLELTPQQVSTLPGADLTVYIKGFQASVDQAVTMGAKPSKVLNAAPQANLTLTLANTQSVGDGSQEEGKGSDTDPHFWLDPVRYKAVVQAIGAKLEAVDPANKALYSKNTAALVQKLDALNADYAKTLATCTNKTIVTGHAAFGYMAGRYGLRQVGVSGVSPDAEPTPQRLKGVSDFVKKNHVTTVYAETLVSPKTTQTIATQTGAKVAVLDPIEGVTSASKGSNYLEIMRSNLATLKSGQHCS